MFKCRTVELRRPLILPLVSFLLGGVTFAIAQAEPRDPSAPVSAAASERPSPTSQPAVREPTTPRIVEHAEDDTMAMVSEVSDFFGNVTDWPLWPEISLEGIAWPAALLILLMGVGAPILSRRTLDALILAATCVLFAVRGNQTMSPDGEHTWQWWSATLLAGTLVYWLIRGVQQFMRPSLDAREVNLSRAGCVLLLVAGIAVAGHVVANAPLKPSSYDGLAGGIHVAETGYLPYGNAPGHDGASPLVYWVHAGVFRLIPSPPADELVGHAPGDYSFDDEELEMLAVVYPLRFVNAVVGTLLLTAIYVLGRQWGVQGAGLVAVALTCLLPPALDLLTDPGIAIAAMLVAWSLAFAMVPYVGGLLSLLAILAAGLAWPWCWLLIPGLLAYFARHSWQVVSATVGLAAGIAGLVIAASSLTQPTIPRAAGLMADAGLQPGFRATRQADNLILIERREPTESAPAHMFAKVFQWLLLAEGATVASASSSADIEWVQTGNGVDPAEVFYRSVEADPTLGATLRQAYRADLADESTLTRTWAGMRTMLEQTWRPDAAEAQPTPGHWELWGAFSEQHADRYRLIRRSIKVLAALLSLAAGIALFLRNQIRPSHLLGAFAVVSAALLLASQDGALQQIGWLVPLMVTLWLTGASVGKVPQITVQQAAQAPPAPRV